jgi:hypothetical protein
VYFDDQDLNDLKSVAHRAVVHYWECLFGNGHRLLKDSIHFAIGILLVGRHLLLHGRLAGGTTPFMRRYSTICP